MHILSFTAKAAAMLFLAECLLSGVGSAKAADMAPSVKQSVTIPTAAALKYVVFSTKAAAAPASLRSFAEQAVSELSEQDSFKNWKQATLTYDPLGPGTHSWLATVSQNGKPVGYLILTSTDDGGYMLSEYGQDESMPYNTQALYNRLKQLGILTAGGKLPAGVTISAQYSALLPVWKVTLPGKKAAVYIHGITAEELPLGAVASDPVSGGLTPRSGLHLTATTLPKQQRTSDPYDNLLWLTSPKLTFTGSGDLIRFVTTEEQSLVFTSPGHNANYGAPFAITGLHAWSSGDQGGTVLYAASGNGGNRFLPAASLMAHGEFRSLNLSQL
ncbi:hypothetical protein [Paenibacillus chibensis]|uniref:hypothetical protein n=1 Tax=Paenibacillus chibensis TaxID=59846 RepID=UPI0013E34062|nr:hypothetical protein [Paenibacillus chibensis]MEC0369113.1 hypothetical protein [Paenibacillus chibensis]